MVAHFLSVSVCGSSTELGQNPIKVEERGSENRK